MASAVSYVMSVMPKHRSTVINSGEGHECRRIGVGGTLPAHCHSGVTLFPQVQALLDLR